MYERILVPVDGSSTCDHGLEEAIGMAQYSGGRLRLIHVVDALSFSICMKAYAGYTGDWLSVLRENGAAILEQAMSSVSVAGVEAETILHDGHLGPFHVLVATEAMRWRADLIVMGRHGRRGAQGEAPGSGAAAVLSHSPVPVLLVPASRTSAADEAGEPVPMHAAELAVT